MSVLFANLFSCYSIVKAPSSLAPYTAYLTPPLLAKANINLRSWIVKR